MASTGRGHHWVASGLGAAAGSARSEAVGADRSGAIVLLRAADAAAARDALGSLPLVANGITSFVEFTEVIPAGEGHGTPA